ncbi:MAG TPA: Uma2 family endonuclease [Micromonosporaceae bacterium]|nr:Uma2 family endonuclease [Micromonosporaceae bacterium]
MSESLVHPPTEPWSIDDLANLPDDGMRYELVDGSLLVSPMPRLPHIRVAYRLRRLLERQAPPDLAIGNEAGVGARSPRSYFVPDVWMVPAAALDRDGQYFQPTEMLLVVEVLSEGNRSVDLLLKRHYYADGGIPEYWIVDPRGRTLTVLRLSDGDLPEGARAYDEHAVVKAGETYRAQTPFPLAVDPAEIL